MLLAVAAEHVPIVDHNTCAVCSIDYQTSELSDHHCQWKLKDPLCCFLFDVLWPLSGTRSMTFYMVAVDCISRLYGLHIIDNTNKLL